ncbi:MAG: hypothetical protein PF439_10385 [Helicobacteraceae bacterium]|jgi:hypothetical protein|nr:hypothetical protein [Helicobacteraceae bacterium]
MTLQERLKDFGCSDEFVEICIYYKHIYKEEIDIEEFIEYVEGEFSKVEDEQFKKAEQQVDASELFGEFESEEEL